MPFADYDVGGVLKGGLLAAAQMISSVYSAFILSFYWKNHNCCFILALFNGSRFNFFKLEEADHKAINKYLGCSSRKQMMLRTILIFINICAFSYCLAK